MSSLKGGVGKTSVTLGLASAALRRGVDTLVVDLDPHGDASTGLGLSAAATKEADAAAVLAAPKKVSFDRNAVPSGWARVPGLGDRARLDVVAGSARALPYDRLPGTAKNLGLLRRALARTDRYDLVLIDCPPTVNSLTRIGWAASDKVLSVAEPSLFSVAGTERTMRAIARFETESEFKVRAASVVLNKVQRHSEEHRYRTEELRGMFGRLVVSPSIAESGVWQQVQGAAYPVHGWPGAEAAEAARGFDAILEGLLG
ncbi:ParA family protein [Rothia sp. AR01]|uniref:ParA family protein n=1 Tax=Rothia santali TaxID=2949643 RepID=A0A9X2HKA8_9MICC|nr:ParA family protein [Rothia santali]MCP3426483.1 ParA family protein [Rothia santali]